MALIGANGLLVLVPCAIFLAGRARADAFDGIFYGAQALELVAGALNLALMGANIRDGVALGRAAGRGAWLTGTSRGRARAGLPSGRAAGFQQHDDRRAQQHRRAAGQHGGIARVERGARQLRQGASQFG